jgi:hypothetical protein
MLKGIKVGKVPHPKGIPNRVLRHPTNSATTFLTKVFNAVFRREYFPLAWKKAPVVPIPKPTALQLALIVERIERNFC